ncbi:MAG: hypothetical protein ACREXW_02950 [Gammaproteobacteria bacterium]
MGVGGIEDVQEEMDAAQREVVKSHGEPEMKNVPSLFERLRGAALYGGEVGKQRGRLGSGFGRHLAA